MNVDVPDALAVQGMAFDEVQHLIALGHHRRRQILQQPEDRLAVAQAPASDFPTTNGCITTAERASRSTSPASPRRR